jgi:2-polyprenyl-3-methyl-5-hydroxy-6-metoxy-1,4-benzoquinol methylase
MWKRLSALVRGPKVYRAKNFAARERYRADYRILAASLLARLPFDSAIDVGCANGFLLESFLEAGREVTGTEVSAAALEIASPAIRDRIQLRDFAASEGVWDLACCVEVAEHIPPERGEELVDVLVRLCGGGSFSPPRRPSRAAAATSTAVPRRTRSPGSGRDRSPATGTSRSR